MPPERPSSLPPDNLISPEVLPDKRVTFRILAPKASEVTIDGEWMLQGPNVESPAR